MNFEPLRTFQLSAEHTMRLTLALAPVLAGRGTDILIFTPGSTALPWSQWSCWYIPIAGELDISFWHVASRKNDTGTLQSKASAGLSTLARYTCIVETGSSLTFLLQFLMGLCVFPLQWFDPKWVTQGFAQNQQNCKSPPPEMIKLLLASLISNQWTN